ncbi:MAG: glycosyltransferase [Planctomycetota bacterium]|nr:glycosyltransferase [Planctomycetota bacterium]
MNILMMTNTFTPFVGGVSRSVTAFAEELRKMGHRVVVVAPEFENMPESECDVIRIPAIQHFNGSDFALVLPIPGYLSTHLERFKPDIVHSHHPHLLGGAAVRIAGRFDCPLVFTYHTMYEHYLHYVPTEAKRLRRFVINLVTGYCDLCDHVIAPSRSVVEILRERGVETPIDVVPTGVDIERFKEGDGCAFRRSHRIPENAFVAGYVGRLAPEKNLSFLAEAVGRFVSQAPQGRFLVVGSGPSDQEVRHIFQRVGHTDRLHLVGSLEGQALTDAYHGMDCFVFASCTETQGMVLTEAMASGRPVVGIDAPGVREVVEDRRNGRLLPSQDVPAFAEAVREMAQAKPEQVHAYRRAARATAAEFSMETSAQKLASVYEKVLARDARDSKDESTWGGAIEAIKAEWELIKNIAEAATRTLRKTE